MTSSCTTGRRFSLLRGGLIARTLAADEQHETAEFYQ